MKKKVQTTKGIKTIYRCNKVKRRGLVCNSGIYTMHDFAPGDPSIKFYRLNLGHNCGNSINRVTKVSNELREYIIDLCKNGETLKPILFKLRRDCNIVQPTSKQVANIIDAYRRSLGNPQISLSDIETFFRQHNSIPENEDEGFVVSFQRSQPDDTEKWSRIFYSTKRLLYTALSAHAIHIDATYKIVIQGYPILIIGVTDFDKHFHLSGLAICTNESSADFQFMFETLMYGVQLVTEQDIRPTAVVADAAKAITKGMKDAFDNEKIDRIDCFAHLKMNINKWKYRKDGNKENIKADLTKLQLAYTTTLFDAGANFLLAKWKEEEPEFVVHFEDVYLKCNRNWYVGASSDSRIPKTNNALESFNRYLKQHQTHYQRKGIASFLNDAIRIVEERSREYINRDREPFQATVIVDDGLLLSGWNYASSPKTMTKLQTSHDGLDFYVFSGENTDQITSDDVRKFNNAKFKNFDDFVEKAFSMHRILFGSNAQDWKNAVCTCAKYSKDYICKHVVGIAFRLQILNPPESLLARVEVPLIQKNQRGRPKKAKKGLLVQ